MSVLIETHYLPSIAYFAALQDVQEIMVEKNEHFVKQSFRNRCHIMSSQGKETLIVPLTSKHGKVYITDVRIDYTQKWLNNHWRAICSAYGKAPFFEHYSEDVEKLLFGKFVFLYELNVQLLSLCLKWLKWKAVVKESLEYEKTPPEGVLDLRSAVNVKKEENLSTFYQAVRYPQVFGKPFAANASLIDLIFCMGPEASRIVQASSVIK